MAHIVEPLVGRSTELAVLDAALEAARGRFVAVAVVGEPGIGKTRLLTELRARADAAGFAVRAAGAAEHEVDLPYAVLADALDLEPGDTPLDGTLRARLEERTQPLALVLDDVHWADPATLELIGALLRDPPAAPVLLALATRPKLGPDGCEHRLDLPELTEDEARELIGERAAAIHAIAGGNPFYLQLLARSSAALVRGPAVRLSGVEVPRATAAAFSREIAQLSDNARHVLAGASIAGDPFSTDLAAVAAGVSDWTALEAIDELLRSGLVRRCESPHRLRFEHALVRAAVYATALGHWRPAAHERVASALKERGASPLQRAHHIQRSARRGDAVAIAVLREAADSVATLSPATATRLRTAANTLTAT
jgi:predicted ATPase